MVLVGGDQDPLSLQFAAAWDSGFDDLLFPTRVRQRQESPSPLSANAATLPGCRLSPAASAGVAFKVTVAAIL